MAQTRSRLKQAFAGFDEINTFWVDKMDLPEAEKKLRVEMMRDFQKSLDSVPKIEKNNSYDWILLAALGYAVYRAIYKEFVDKFYIR